MAQRDWTWAPLSNDQLGLLDRAEKTLGVDFLLAYQADEQPGLEATGQTPGGLRPAALSESQLDCLRGLEQQLSATVVAYRNQA